METSTPSRVGVGVVVTDINDADAAVFETIADTVRTFIIFSVVGAVAAAVAVANADMVVAGALAVPFSSSFLGLAVGDRLLPSSLPFMLLLRDTITSEVAESGP